MKFQTRLIKILRMRTHKRRADDVKDSDMPDDEKVTKEIAKKIVDDARIHRLAIEEDLNKDT